jgi:uncharacterized caspase-like protein
VPEKDTGPFGVEIKSQQPGPKMKRGLKYFQKHQTGAQGALVYQGRGQQSAYEKLSFLNWDELDGL